MTDWFPTAVSALCTLGGGYALLHVTAAKRHDEDRDRRLEKLERAMARVLVHVEYLRQAADPEYRPTLSSLSDPPSEPPGE